MENSHTYTQKNALHHINEDKSYIFVNMSVATLVTSGFLESNCLIHNLKLYEVLHLHEQ